MNQWLNIAIAWGSMGQKIACGSEKLLAGAWASGNCSREHGGVKKIFEYLILKLHF